MSATDLSVVPPIPAQDDEDGDEEVGVESGAEPLGAGAEEGAEEPVVEEAPPPPKLLQDALPGDWDSISDAFGGAAPEFSEIRLLGGKMPIEGSFAKGTEFDVLVRVRVTGVLGQDVTDDYGRTTKTIRRHMARMVDVRRANR